MTFFVETSKCIFFSVHASFSFIWDTCPGTSPGSRFLVREIRFWHDHGMLAVANERRASLLGIIYSTGNLQWPSYTSTWIPGILASSMATYAVLSTYVWWHACKDFNLPHQKAIHMMAAVHGQLGGVLSDLTSYQCVSNWDFCCRELKF
jgi:hypothetical protein